MSAAVAGTDRRAGARRQLPEFPWNRLTEAAELARSHADGLVDLSVGTPVDPTPEVARRALAGAADAPGYPTTHGTAALREAAVGWLRRTLGVTGVAAEAVLPAIGSKELVAWLPTLLGIGAGDQVGYPVPAYPTYEIGALLAGAEPVPLAEEQLLDADLSGVRLLWLNSPANPHGRVLPVATLRALVTRARAAGTVIACDECYIELGWEGTAPVSVLHPDVCGDDTSGLLAVHSLSKRSNLAGYRAAFVCGDAELVAALLEVRKHAGFMLPTPVQAAMTAVLDDDAHVAEQRERYLRRRGALRSALLDAGFRVEHSEAGLYLWATRDEPCWSTVNLLAKTGILVAPGEFYGPSGARHVRVALTATDERVAAAVRRLRAL